MTLNEIKVIDGIADKIHTTAIMKGFWNEPRSWDSLLIRLHEEISEASESVRNGVELEPSEHIPEFKAIEEEIADIVIRAFDTARGRNLKIAAAISAKMAFNRDREYKHGKKY